MTASEVLSVTLAVLGSIGGGAAIIFGLSSWLGKVWAERILADEKAKYERELEGIRSKYVAETERLKADLQRNLFEHQTHFSWYHEKKMEMIAELYRLLHITHARIREVVHPLQIGSEDSRREFISETTDQYNLLAAHFYGKRIFLDQDLADQVDDVVKAMRIAFTNWGIAQDRSSAPTKESLKLWKDSYDVMENAVPTLLKELERKFRAIVLAREDPAA